MEEVHFDEEGDLGLGASDTAPLLHRPLLHHGSFEGSLSSHSDDSLLLTP